MCSTTSRKSDQEVLGAGNSELSDAGGKTDPGDITGSVARRRRKEAAKARGARRRDRKPEGTVVHPDEAQRRSRPPSARSWSGCRRAARNWKPRAREIDIRESLLKSAEKRIEAKVEEMKAVESRISDRDRAEGRSRSRALQGHRHHV